METRIFSEPPLTQSQQIKLKLYEKSGDLNQTVLEQMSSWSFRLTILQDLLKLRFLENRIANETELTSLDSIVLKRLRAGFPGVTQLELCKLYVELGVSQSLLQDAIDELHASRSKVS
jgi:hypothetical protein